jgi:hypothetical protein
MTKMPKPSCLRKVLWAGLLLIAAVLLTALVLAILPAPPSVLAPINGAACLRVFEDQNGNGAQDAGEPSLQQLRSAYVDVTDPANMNGGRFALSRCYLQPDSQWRTVHLAISLPAGYRATTPAEYDVAVFDPVGFYDYLPTRPFGVQPVSQP